MHLVLGLAVVWLLWKIYSDNRSAEREHARREVLEEAQREVREELRHLEQRLELEEQQLEVEERQFELEEQRIEFEEERSGRRFEESRAKLQDWQRRIEDWRQKIDGLRELLREWRARERETLRPALLDSKPVRESQVRGNEAPLPRRRADSADVRRSACEDQEDDGGWPGYGE